PRGLRSLGLLRLPPAERPRSAFAERLHRPPPPRPPLADRSGAGVGGALLLRGASRGPHRPLPAPRRDRPRRHGSGGARARRRPGAGPRSEGAPRAAPEAPRDDRALRRGGADRRTAPAPGHRPGVRAGTLP